MNFETVFITTFVFLVVFGRVSGWLWPRRIPPSGQDKLITDPPPLAKPGQVAKMLDSRDDN